MPVEVRRLGDGLHLQYTRGPLRIGLGVVPAYVVDPRPDGTDTGPPPRQVRLDWHTDADQLQAVFTLLGGPTEVRGRCLRLGRLRVFNGLQLHRAGVWNPRGRAFVFARWRWR